MLVRTTRPIGVGIGVGDGGDKATRLDVASGAFSLAMAFSSEPSRFSTLSRPALSAAGAPFASIARRCRYLISACRFSRSFCTSSMRVLALSRSVRSRRCVVFASSAFLVTALMPSTALVINVTNSSRRLSNLSLVLGVLSSPPAMAGAGAMARSEYSASVFQVRIMGVSPGLARSRKIAGFSNWAISNSGGVAGGIATLGNSIFTGSGLGNTGNGGAGTSLITGGAGKSTFSNSNGGSASVGRGAGLAAVCIGSANGGSPVPTTSLSLGTDCSACKGFSAFALRGKALYAPQAISASAKQPTNNTVYQNVLADQESFVVGAKSRAGGRWNGRGEYSPRRCEFVDSAT